MPYLLIERGLMIILEKLYALDKIQNLANLYGAET